MLRLKRNPVFFITTAVFLSLILLIDIISLYLPISFNILYHLKELFFLGSILFLYFDQSLAIATGQMSHESMAFQIVKDFLKLGIMLIVLIILHGFDNSWMDVNLSNKKTMSDILSSSFICIGSSYYFIRILLHIKALIFFKRYKSTSILYHFILYGILIVNISSLLLDEAIPPKSDDVITFILYVMLIIIMFLASFRNSWVSYLSRKNKYVYSIASVALIAYQSFFIHNFLYGDQFSILEHYTVSSKNIIYLLAIFSSVYTLFTFFYLLIQLPTSRFFERKMKELKSLHQLSVAINSEQDFNKLMLVLTTMVNDTTEAGSVWLEMLDEKNGQLYIASSKKLSSQEIRQVRLDCENGMSGKIFREKKSIVLNDINADEHFSYLKRWKKDAASIIGVPMITTKQKILGIIFATKSYEFGFDPDDVSLLESIANQAVIAIENTRLLNDSLQRERLEQELKIAKDVQNKLLPQNNPAISGIDLASAAFTANEVGGDYYDFLKLNSKNAIIMADVSGKGTSAAFYMAELKGIVKSLSLFEQDPLEIMKKTNKILTQHLEKKSFITASIISFESKNKIHFVRAGHCPLLHYRSGSHEIVSYCPRGLALGMGKADLFDSLLEKIEINLVKDDVFCLFTDGINEARNIFDDEYGDSALEKTILTHAASSAETIKHAILDDVIRHTGKAEMHDDMTLIIIKVN